MKPILSEEDIEKLLREPKAIPHRYLRWLATRKVRNKHVSEGSKALTGAAGHTFELYFRRCFAVDPKTERRIDRSSQFTVRIILVVGPHRYELIRCDRHRTPHTNWLEKHTRTGIAKIPSNQPHIHRITERYQRAAVEVPERFQEYQYAQPTDEFATATAAIEFAVAGYGFTLTGDPYGATLPLFGDPTRD